jgi:hypothetical protein
MAVHRAAPARTVATAATGKLPFSVGQVIYVDGGLSLSSY